MKRNIKSGVVDARQTAFLEEYVKFGYHIQNACDKIGIKRYTFREWLATDEEFAEKFNDLEEAVKDDDERLMRRLFHGIPKRNKQGEITSYLVKPNVRAGMFLLEAKAPERGFRKNYTVNITNEEDIEVKSLEDIKLEMERLATNIKTDSND